MRRTMSGHDLIGDRADRDFLLIRGDAADGAPRLAEAGTEFGVLTDSAGRPRLLLSRGGAMAPAVTVAASVPMGRVLGADIVRLLNSGLPGLVVADESGTAGILSAAAIVDYLLEHSPVRSGLLGGSELHGDAADADLLHLRNRERRAVFRRRGDPVLAGPPADPGVGLTRC